MKPKYIFGVLAALALVTTAVLSLESKKIEYMDFRSAQQGGTKAQISGTWVKAGGDSYDATSDLFKFTMKDQKGNEMPVVLHGPKPNNFELATQIVATGRIENGAFHATNVLTKCPSKYEANPDDLKRQMGT